MTTETEGRRLRFYKAARMGITPKAPSSAVNPPFTAPPAAVGPDSPGPDVPGGHRIPSGAAGCGGPAASHD